MVTTSVSQVTGKSRWFMNLSAAMISNGSRGTASVSYLGDELPVLSCSEVFQRCVSDVVMCDRSRGNCLSSIDNRPICPRPGLLDSCGRTVVAGPVAAQRRQRTLGPSSCLIPRKGQSNPRLVFEDDADR